MDCEPKRVVRSCCDCFGMVAIHFIGFLELHTIFTGDIEAVNLGSAELRLVEGLDRVVACFKELWACFDDRVELGMQQGTPSVPPLVPVAPTHNSTPQPPPLDRQAVSSPATSPPPTPETGMTSNSLSPTSSNSPTQSQTGPKGERVLLCRGSFFSGCGIVSPRAYCSKDTECYTRLTNLTLPLHACYLVPPGKTKDKRNGRNRKYFVSSNSQNLEYREYQLDVTSDYEKKFSSMILFQPEGAQLLKEDPELENELKVGSLVKVTPDLVMKGENCVRFRWCTAHHYLYPSNLTIVNREPDPARPGDPTCVKCSEKRLQKRLDKLRGMLAGQHPFYGGFPQAGAMPMAMPNPMFPFGMMGPALAPGGMNPAFPMLQTQPNPGLPPLGGLNMLGPPMNGAPAHPNMFVGPPGLPPGPLGMGGNHNHAVNGGGSNGHANGVAPPPPPVPNNLANGGGLSNGTGHGQDPHNHHGHDVHKQPVGLHNGPPSQPDVGAPFGPPPPPHRSHGAGPPPGSVMGNGVGGLGHGGGGGLDEGNSGDRDSGMVMKSEIMEEDVQDQPHLIPQNPMGLMGPGMPGKPCQIPFPLLRQHLVSLQQNGKMPPGGPGPMPPLMSIPPGHPGLGMGMGMGLGSLPGNGLPGQLPGQMGHFHQHLQGHMGLHMQAPLHIPPPMPSQIPVHMQGPLPSHMQAPLPHLQGMPHMQAPLHLQGNQMQLPLPLKRLDLMPPHSTHPQNGLHPGLQGQGPLQQPLHPLDSPHFPQQHNPHALHHPNPHLTHFYQFAPNLHDGPPGPDPHNPHHNPHEPLPPPHNPHGHEPSLHDHNSHEHHMDPPHGLHHLSHPQDHLSPPHPPHHHSLSPQHMSLHPGPPPEYVHMTHPHSLAMVGLPGEPSPKRQKVT
eukprot:g20005.t1